MALFLALNNGDSGKTCNLLSQNQSVFFQDLFFSTVRSNLSTIYRICPPATRCNIYMSDAGAVNHVLSMVRPAFLYILLCLQRKRNQPFLGCERCASSGKSQKSERRTSKFSFQEERTASDIPPPNDRDSLGRHFQGLPRHTISMPVAPLEVVTWKEDIYLQCTLPHSYPETRPIAAETKGHQNEIDKI